MIHGRHNTSRQQGFTLLEILVAMTILAVGILALGTMQISAIRANDFAGSLNGALNLATDRLERLMTLPYTSITTAGAPTTVGAYTLNWTVTDNSPLTDSKTVAVVVAWVERGDPRQVTVRHILPRI